MPEKLLTVAIPTYNRAGLLDICLSNLLPQIKGKLADQVEVIVFDNDSPDNTYGIVGKHINYGFPVKYFKQPENLGPDKNITSCFLGASGKYVWIFSDDDIVISGYLKLIFELLENNDFGNIYVNTSSFNGEYKNIAEEPGSINYTIYNDPLEFGERVNYWSTFLSGNIVNKSLFHDYSYVSGFYSTFLVQLSWVLPIIFAGKPNIVINDQAVACLANNTGGYNLYEVFGKNYNQLMDRLIAKRLIDKKIKAITNKHLLKTFFPMFLFTKMVKADNALKIMIPIYWSYGAFWKTIFPVLIKKQIKRLW